MQLICKACEAAVTVYLFHLKEITLYTSKEPKSSLMPWTKQLMKWMYLILMDLTEQASSVVFSLLNVLLYQMSLMEFSGFNSLLLKSFYL